MSRILVTGGSGLLGWPAVQQLAAAGHDPVVYDLRPSSENLRLIGDDVAVVQGDVLDFANLLRVVKAHRIERILHLAAVITNNSAHRPVEAIRGNVLATSYILEIAHALDLDRVVWASTVSVNGTPRGCDGSPVPEDYGFSPTDPYGVSKLACEIMARVYRDDLDLDVAAIRPPIAFGIGRLSGSTGALNSAIRDLAITGHAETPSFDPIESQLI
jgi:UDP-glucose 4-epimerase